MQNALRALIFGNIHLISNVFFRKKNFVCGNFIRKLIKRYTYISFLYAYENIISEKNKKGTEANFHGKYQNGTKNIELH